MKEHRQHQTQNLSKVKKPDSLPVPRGTDAHSPHPSRSFQKDSFLPLRPKKNNRYNSLRVNTDTLAFRAFRAMGVLKTFLFAQ